MSDLDISLVSAILNGASIMTFVGIFWFMNSRGMIITRRENNLTLGIKDQVIAMQQKTIDNQQETIRDLSEVHETWKQFIQGATQHRQEGRV